MPRQSAARIRLIAHAAPAPMCFCGGTEYAYSFDRFPMRHAARCKACGLEHRAELKIAAPQAAKPQPPAPDYGFPPFWY